MADVAVFVSYRHDDDDAAYGRIKQISDDIGRTYKGLSGLEVGLFFDTESIDLGDRWRERIRSGLVDATILLAFISPLYLRSPSCREELQKFISAVSDTNSQKLIIPLLFTPADNIEESFGADEMWLQIVSLQYLAIHELRTADPGSSQWMVKVSVVAERMRRALAVPNLNVPPSAVPIENAADQPSEPGTLELLTDLESGLPALNECVLQLSNLIAEFNGRITVATPQMADAASSREKLAVANTLADQLEPITDQFSKKAIEFQRNVEIVDAGNRAIFRMLRATPREQWNEDTIQYPHSVKTLAESSLSGITSMLEFYNTIDGSKGFSSRLDKPLQRLQSAILTMSGVSGIYKHWLDEIAELDQQS